MSVAFGDFKYKVTNYRGAAKSYKKYLNDDENQYNIEVIRKLAFAYQKSNQSELAEQTFAKLTILDSSFSDVLAYSEMLMKNKKYDSLEKFIQKNPELTAKNDTRFTKVITTVNNVNQLVSIDTGNIKITKLSFNSSNSDLAPSIFQNGIIFSSNRISNSLFNIKKRKLNKNYVGLYVAISDDGFKSVKRFAKNLSYKGNYGHASYHSKTRTLYYVVNSKPKKSNSTEKDLNIYSSRFDFNNDTWSTSKMFPYNSPNYSNTSPFVNQDGTRFYFSSNMPGGFGGFDLYVCLWIDSMWTKPINLGAKINSTGDELYPFVDNTNLLHFASNGRGGLGGLDIFTYDLLNANAESDNMAAPINSNTDDFGFIKYAKAEKGYFSSSRESNGNESDIYSFTRVKATTKNITIKIVDQKTNTIIPNSEIAIKQDQTISTFILINGTKQIESTEPGKIFYVTAIANNYDTSTIEIVVNRTDTLYYVELKKQIEGCSLQGIVKNKTTNEILRDVTISITNLDNENDQFVVKTDNKGYYKVIGLKKNSQYKIQVQLDGYFTSIKNLKTLNTCIPVNNSYDYIENFNLISGSIVKLDNIYFDFNKVDIRSDAAKELDKIVAFMNENPEVIVELYSHTDARGSDELNKMVSDKRASESVNYICNKGISRNRITGRGFGETKLLNNCINDVECTEEQHQINRRTELKVVNVIDQP
jgi:outer membrane protein OmpA-like peptidoglycan-associated protein/tetratricopeptide (TPR) repeat protein